MSTTARGLTYADLETIPQEREGDRHELIDGELIVTPSPMPRHQIIVKNLTYRLEQHIDAGDLGTLIPAPIDVWLSPHDLLVPDLIFISRQRQQLIGAKAVRAAPDLVIEILSPGTRRRDLTSKRALYARFGVQEYWIVDPEARTVTVLTLTDKGYETVPAGKEGAIQSRVFPNLALTPEAVFKGVDADS
jgi:Uma2 family endonuclease